MKTSPAPLYLVPAPLDFGCETQTPLPEVLSDGALRTASQLRYWICENAKTTRAYLKRIHATHALPVALQDIHIQELPREWHKKGDAAGSESLAQQWLAPALQGNAVGLCSEAGMPAIADPGSLVVRCAHRMGIPVVTLPGPMSLMLGLASSGLQGQRFAFVGYLATDPSQRIKAIQQLEQRAWQIGETQIAIETPYRNAALVKALLESLRAETWLSVSCGLTLEGAVTRAGTVKHWRQKGLEDLPLQWPAVFSWGP